MCGIAGVCLLDAGGILPPETDAHVRAMTAAIAHRGPDGGGLWRSGPVCLGHRRLSVIDLEGGAQPMADASGHLHVVTNGEIYNFRELRGELSAAGHVFRTSSDTEIILAAYRQWGVDCLRRLDGMFAFALWDSDVRRLFCARDRFGKKPFFHVVRDGRFVFASEIGAIAALPGISLDLAPAALTRYLAYDYVPTPDTPYAGVRSLPPSHWLILEDGEVRIGRYWDMPAPNEDDGRSEEELGEELRSLMTAAVRRRLISDVPLGIFLSGGVDSSIVAALAAMQSDTPIRTFSIGFQEASYDESRYAELVAERYGTRHHVRVLDADACADILPSVIGRMDAPLADASVAPTWLLSGIAREDVTVALGGDGADELWAGYEHYIAFGLAERYSRWPAWLRHGVVEPLCRRLPAGSGYVNLRLATDTFMEGAASPAWMRVQTLLTSLRPELQREVLLDADEDLLRPERLFASTEEHYAHWPEAAPLARAFHVYVRQFMLDDILVKVDRCSMMHGLEVRAPFLDTALAEFTARLPLRHKLRRFDRKHLLKRTFRGILPDAIAHRSKRGFQIPVAAWLRGRLRGLMEDMLSPERLRRQGLFRPDAVRKLVDAHLSGAADLRRPLWNLLVWQIWLDARERERA